MPSFNTLSWMSYLTVSTTGSGSEHTSSASRSTPDSDQPLLTCRSPARLEAGAVTHEYKTVGARLVPALPIKVQALNDAWPPETPALVAVALPW